MDKKKFLHFCLIYDNYTIFFTDLHAYAFYSILSIISYAFYLLYHFKKLIFFNAIIFLQEDDKNLTIYLFLLFIDRFVYSETSPMALDINPREEV